MILEPHTITLLKSLLTDLKEVASEETNGVQMPIGDKSIISHTGNIVICRNQKLRNVLYVPTFKFNLLSISKLTKELNCSVTFYPEFCLF